MVEAGLKQHPSLSTGSDSENFVGSSAIPGFERHVKKPQYKKHIKISLPGGFKILRRKTGA